MRTALDISPNIDGISFQSDHRSAHSVELDPFTGTRRGFVTRFNSVFLPVAIAAAFFTPTDVFARRRVQVWSTTPLYEMSWDAFRSDEAPWSYVPELVTMDQVRALDDLFALPAVSELNLRLAE